MEGAAFLTKADTMARADRSSLTSKPGTIYGARRVRSQSLRASGIIDVLCRPMQCASPGWQPPCGQITDSQQPTAAQQLLLTENHIIVTLCVSAMYPFAARLSVAVCMNIRTALIGQQLHTGVQPSEKGRAMAGQYSYDGWSCVRRMENNEPPLMQCYSNPKKARLTVEVLS